MKILFWWIVRWALLQRYGFRGGLRPPLGRNSPPWDQTSHFWKDIWYAYRVAMWKIDSALYQKSGIADEWWEGRNKDYE